MCGEQIETLCWTCDVGLYTQGSQRGHEMKELTCTRMNAGDQSKSHAWRVTTPRSTYSRSTSADLGRAESASSCVMVHSAGCRVYGFPGSDMRTISQDPVPGRGVWVSTKYPSAKRHGPLLRERLWDPCRSGQRESCFSSYISILGDI